MRKSARRPGSAASADLAAPRDAPILPIFQPDEFSTTGISALVNEPDLSPCDYARMLRTVHTEKSGASKREVFPSSWGTCSNFLAFSTSAARSCNCRYVRRAFGLANCLN